MVSLLKVPLSQAELDHLGHVVAELEKKTTGEIRLIIVKSSSHHGHLLRQVWFMLSTLALFGLWIERHLLIWTADWWLVPAVFLLTFLLAYALSRLPWMARTMAPVEDLNRQALLRAELEFHREGLGATSGKTGILLFISMLEHQAVVLADKGIAERLNEATWAEVVATMLEGPKSGQWAGPLEKALRQCGALLAQHFPAQLGDKNELPNHVIVKE